jgi:hypothetical protein
MISQAEEMAMVRDNGPHGVVRIIFEDLEDLSPELEGRIRKAGLPRQRPSVFVLIWN